VYSLGDGQFLVDARESEALEPAVFSGLDTALSEAPGEMSLMETTEGDGLLYGTDVFHAQSLTFSNGFLVFNIQGLTPGDTFLLARKTILNDDFTNYWVPQPGSEFVASDSNQVVTIPVPQDSPTGFCLVVDWSQYQGPQPTIVSPIDAATASGGSVVVQGSLTDIYPPKSAQLLIDGLVVQSITNGPLRFTFDSTGIGNSTHVIKIVVTSQIWYDPTNGYATPTPVDPTYSFPLDSATSLNNLTTSNFLAISSAPYAATADYGQAVFGIDTSVSARIDLTIADGPTNSPFKHISTTNDTPGTAFLTWDLTRDDSSPVSVPGNYSVKITAQTLSGPPADAQSDPANGKVIWVSLIKFSHLGQLLVTRTRISNNLLRDDNQQRITQAAADAEWNASRQTPNDPADFLPRGPNPRNAVVFESSLDYQTFWTYGTNASEGELEYVGHSRPEDGAFGSGDDAVGSPNRVIDPDEVEEHLGNNYNPSDGSYTFNNAKAFVRIEGCSSGFKTSHMNWYFGIPDPPIPGLSPSVWLGWAVSYEYHGSWGFDSPFERHINDFQGWWSNLGFGGITVTTAIANSFGSMGEAEYIPLRVVHGTQDMHWAY
jgi:hypothetical protein